jgi:hypothetical protein
MTVTDDIITNALLSSLDKLLVLNHGHGLTVKRIKQLTTATSVKKMKPTRSELEGFVWNMVWNVNRYVNNTTNNLDVYMVKGDAKSSMLALMNCMVVAFDPSAKQIKIMHNAATSIFFIDRFRALISHAVELHEDLNAEFKRNTAVTNKIYRWSKSLKTMDAKYGDSERKQLVTLLKQEFKSTW